jgi:hypothetical protein
MSALSRWNNYLVELAMDIPLLDTSTRNTHDHTANDDRCHVRGSTSDGGADDEDEAEEDENPAHVEDEENLACEAEGGEEGKGVGEADPWEELN